MSVRHLPASERRPVPWKNGGGVTREIAAFPEGAGMDGFDWRISMAEVASAGPFSRFEGIDRVLTVLEGTLVLELAGAVIQTLTPASQPFAFAGDVDCRGAPQGGPVLDLNVMVRHGTMRAEVRRTEGAEIVSARGDSLFVLALEAGTVGGLRLERYDGLLGDCSATLATEGAVRLLVVDLFRA